MRVWLCVYDWCGVSFATGSKQASRSSSLSHVFVEELTMEVIARRVVDEALLVLGLVSTLVLEHGVVIPSTPYACASWSELEQR